MQYQYDAATCPKCDTEIIDSDDERLSVDDEIWSCPECGFIFKSVAGVYIEASDTYKMKDSDNDDNDTIDLDTNEQDQLCEYCGESIWAASKGGVVYCAECGQTPNDSSNIDADTLDSDMDEESDLHDRCD